MGWFTVVLYALAGWRCYRLAKDGSGLHVNERIIWWIIAIGLFALGVNKQLDLQSALTEVGRMLAKQQGWYAKRQEVQVEFIYAVALVAALAAMLLAYLARKSPAATLVALVGAVCLLAFVVIRAASFHHFDRIIGSTLLGFRMNWIFEMGGLAIILVGATWRALARSAT